MNLVQLRGEVGEAAWRLALRRGHQAYPELFVGERRVPIRSVKLDYLPTGFHLTVETFEQGAVNLVGADVVYVTAVGERHRGRVYCAQWRGEVNALASVELKVWG